MLKCAAENLSGAPASGNLASASPQEMGRVQAAWEMVEAFGCEARTRPVAAKHFEKDKLPVSTRMDTQQKLKMAWSIVAALAGIGLLAGCGGSDLTPVLGCEDDASIRVDCQFQSPEDLALAPDGRIIVSQFSGMTGERSGNLALYEPETRSLEVVFPTSPADAGLAAEQGEQTANPSVNSLHGSGGDLPSEQDANGGEEAAAPLANADRGGVALEWGEADCPPPDPAAFSPHGIDLERRNDGRWQLAVVNHGGRESVELLELLTGGALAWRGCVLAPQDGYFNDLVLLRDGGFWVTHMFPKGSGLWSFVKSGFGMNTGWVYAWSPVAGFSKLPGSDAPFPNGIEKSPDERYAYVNSYSSQGLRKIEAATGKIVAARELTRLDNSTWAGNGRLLVASHPGDFTEGMRCQNLAQGACGMPFAIFSLDPEDLSGDVLIAHQGGPMGGVTVALERRGALFLGTFAGDRIGIVDFPQGS